MWYYWFSIIYSSNVNPKSSGLFMSNWAKVTPASIARSLIYLPLNLSLNPSSLSFLFTWTKLSFESNARTTSANAYASYFLINLTIPILVALRSGVLSSRVSISCMIA